MPYTQRAAWLNVQKNDRTHQQLSWLIETSQTPEKKKTKGENTKLKLLHNLYKNGLLRKASDGLITVTNADNDRGNTQAISVPSPMFPGLIQALHLKLNHPSKTQLQRVSSRYFYSPGNARIIEEISTNCSVCATLKQLPTELFSESTTINETFGSNFSADVVKRDGQKILLVREKLSQFTVTCFVADETADSLRDGLISNIIEMIPASGAVVQVDAAPAFQTLKTESDSKGSLLQKLGIKVDLGRTLNKNKNPVAENAIKEFHKECLRLNPSGGPLSEINRAMITKNMNERIRDRGFSSKEIAYQRDQISNESQPISDVKMAEKQFEKRKEKHPKEYAKNHETFQIGENVLLKSGKTKLRGREMYKIVDIYSNDDEIWATLQKTESQFRSKQYQVKTAEIFHVPGPVSNAEILSENGTEHEKDNKVDIDVDKHDVKEITEDKETLEERLNEDVSNGGRKKRNAAVLARKRIKKMATESVLEIKIKNKAPPLHAWNWESFNQLIESDVIVRKIPKQASEFGDSSEEEAELSWDNSPEQFEMHPKSSDEEFNNILMTRNLFSTEDENCSLTSSTSDENVFFQICTTRLKHLKGLKEPKVLRDTRFKRQLFSKI